MLELMGIAAKTKAIPEWGRLFECPGQDLNLHGLPRYHLKVVRLPISPPGREWPESIYGGLDVSRVMGALRSNPQAASYLGIWIKVFGCRSCLFPCLRAD